MPWQDCEIQVYGYRNVGDPQCLWTFFMKDSVLSLSTELEGGRVRTLTLYIVLVAISANLAVSLKIECSKMFSMTFVHFTNE